MKIDKNVAGNLPYPRNYADTMLVIEEGKGVYLKDVSGKEYLDFGSGIAVNALGYGREDLAEIAYGQMKKLVHISNLYATLPALELGEKIVRAAREFAGHSSNDGVAEEKPDDFCAVHFGNSGTEANEAAIKYARLYGMKTKGSGKHKLMSFTGGFHGRTMGALSVTANTKYSDPFVPLIPGTVTCKFNDVEAFKKTINSDFAAVIVEVVQGEGGLEIMSSDFADALNEECAKHDVILIADEIQTGLGRIGCTFASGCVGLKPDIISLSKPLAGGLPLSATIIPKKINDLLKPGYHGTTFGGGPVTTSVALKIWDTVTEKSFLDKLQEKAGYLEGLLDTLIADFPFLTAKKGAGMLRGIVVNEDYISVAEILKRCQDAGLLLLRSGTNVIRIAPPLIISNDELQKGITILRSVLNGVKI